MSDRYWLPSLVRFDQGSADLALNDTHVMVKPSALYRFPIDDTAVCRALFLSLPRNVLTSCVAEPRPATSSPGIVVQHADAPGLIDGLIWPKTGCASIV